MSNSSIVFETALRLAETQLEQNLKHGHPFYTTPPPEGWLRGLDVYDRSVIPSVIANASCAFFKAHGFFPNLVHPQGFNEKIIWSNFFSHIKVPQSGNKLLTRDLIPDALRNEVNCPEIVWSNTNPVLPFNHEIDPGYYYLKSNHGSGMFKRIRYPLTSDEFAELNSLCKEWLDTKYGITTGEWWYSIFQKSIMIEREVVVPDSSIAWIFYTFSGQIPFIAAYIKRHNDKQISWLDSNYNLLPFQNPLVSRVENINLSDHRKPKLLQLASAIGSQFRFARIDFLIGADDVIYLGEVTFAPNNGQTRRPAEFDLMLGNMWKLYD